jgi:hypothetical protein
MYKITIEIARNGIVKTINDDNYNSAGESYEQTTVYDLEDDRNDTTEPYRNTSNFLYELCEDLGIDLGGKRDRHTLRINKEFGDDYQLEESELKIKLREYQNEVKVMREELKILKEFDKQNK